MAARVRRLGNYGAAKIDLLAECGTNSRLDELQAAFLGVRLDYLERWNASRPREDTRTSLAVRRRRPYATCP